MPSALKNVEKIQFIDATFDAGKLDAAPIAGVEDFIFSDSITIKTSAEIKSASTQNLVFKGIKASDAIDLTGETVNLVIDGSTVTVTYSPKTLNVTSTGTDAKNILKVDSNGGTAALTTLNIKGDASIDIGSGAADGFSKLTKLDGSAATGDITANIKLTTVSGAEILGGAGKDNITISGTGATAVTDYKIDGGVGGDTITLVANVGTVVVKKGESGLYNGDFDVISNFVSDASGGANKLAIAGGATEKNFKSVQDTTVENLAQAVSDANANVFNKSIQFAVYYDDISGASGANATTAYVVVDYDLNGTADMAVKLIGGSTGKLGAFLSADEIVEA